VLTAKADEDNEVRVFELGADDFITKPFRPGRSRRVSRPCSAAAALEPAADLPPDRPAPACPPDH